LPLALAASLASGCAGVQATQIQAAAQLAGALFGKQLLPPPKLISDRLVPLFIKGLAEGQLPALDQILKILGATNGTDVGKLPDLPANAALDITVPGEAAAFALLDRSGVFTIKQGTTTMRVGTGLASPVAEQRWATENVGTFDDAPVFAASPASRKYRLQQASEVDLRGEFPPVMAQGNRSTCVQFATAGHLAYLNKKAGLNLGTASPQQMCWLYNVVMKSRMDKRNLWNDNGSIPAAFYQVLKLEGNREVTGSNPYVPAQLGAMSEAEVPYDKNLAAESPDAGFQEMARRSLGSDMAAKVAGGQRFTTQGAYYFRVKNDDASFEAALLDGHPIQLGYPVVNDDWNTPGGQIPDYEESRRPDAYHNVLIVGFKRDASAPGGGWYIVRNSWGKNWGDGGHGYISYRMTRRFGEFPFIANAYKTSFKARFSVNPPPNEPPPADAPAPAPDAPATEYATEPLPSAAEIDGYTEADEAAGEDIDGLFAIVDDFINAVLGPDEEGEE